MQGLKVVVTRARSQAGQLVDLLDALGAEIIEYPTIEIRSPDPPPQVDSLDGYDWVVFTSRNGVVLFAEACARAGKVFLDIAGARICAVGPATAEALRELGLRVDLLPEEYVAESLLDALTDGGQALAGKRFLLPRGDIARSFLPKELKKLGAEVTELVVYETVRPAGAEEGAPALVASRPDVVTFTSSSSARNLCELLGASGLDALKRGTAFASIGPKTTETAEQLGLTVEIDAKQHDIPGLVDAVVEWAARR